MDFSTKSDYTVEGSLGIDFFHGPEQALKGSGSFFRGDNGIDDVVIELDLTDKDVTLASIKMTLSSVANVTVALHYRADHEAYQTQVCLYIYSNMRCLDGTLVI